MHGSKKPPMKTIALALMFSAAFVAPSFADNINPKIELKLHAFRDTTSSGMFNKEIRFEVKNGTDKMLQFVGVQCGFYDADNALVKIGGRLLENIRPGETAPHSIRVDSPDAVRAACRIDTVEPSKAAHDPSFQKSETPLRRHRRRH